MPELPRIGSQDCLAALQKLGFIVVRQKGSHVVLRRGSSGCRDGGGQPDVGISEIIEAKVAEGRPPLTSLTVKSQVDFMSVDADIVSEREGAIRVRMLDPIVSGEFKAKLSVTYELLGEGSYTDQIMVCGQVDDTIQAWPPLVQISLSDSRSADVKIMGVPEGEAEIKFFGFSKGMITGNVGEDGVFSILVDDAMKASAAGGAILHWSEVNLRLVIPISIKR